MSPHLTARDKAARKSAQAAVARAWAHTRPPAPPEDDAQHLGDLYPYVTHARARQIRQEIEESRHDHHR